MALPRSPFGIPHGAGRPHGHRAALLYIFVLLCCGCAHTSPTTPERPPTVATFSIVAFDAATGELGIAVQSRVVSVGAVVPWARAGVGAIATQAWANTSYGPTGLKLLAEGKSPAQVVKLLTANDDRREQRQIGIVDATGRVATFTGKKCKSYAGGRTGAGYTIQGNILAGEDVVIAMEEAFKSSSKRDLGERMIAALRAGQAAGGDTRGKQSAALLIVRAKQGYGGFNDRYRDVRVDDHEHPIEELHRIYQIHKKTFPLRTR